MNKNKIIGNHILFEGQKVAAILQGAGTVRANFEQSIVGGEESQESSDLPHQLELEV